MAKAASTALRYYFDSCLFIALINDDPTRCPVVGAILDDAENGDCEVYTSQLAVVEVAYAEQEKKGKALSAAAENKIDKLWHPSSPVKLVDVHPSVAIEARKIIRDAMKEGWTKGEDWSVKPNDSTHIATAKLIHANCFFTYDKRLLKLTKTGVVIREPYLKQGRLGINIS